MRANISRPVLAPLLYSHVLTQGGSLYGSWSQPPLHGDWASDFAAGTPVGCCPAQIGLTDG
jgi:hypothetical protein